MKTLKKAFGWIVGFAVVVAANVADGQNEWSDIQYIQGSYSRIYFDYVTNGSGLGTFYCINDWVVNQADGGVNGGVKATEYNQFPFTLGGDKYEIRIYPTFSQVFKNNILGSSLNGFVSATGWTNSPNSTLNHSIWEFCFTVASTTITSFLSCDPAGGAISIFVPASPPNNLPVGPSLFPHFIDGAFADSLAINFLPPTPSRLDQTPVPDPGFLGEFELVLRPEGGVDISIVPEPETWMQVGSGFAILFLALKNKCKPQIFK